MLGRRVIPRLIAADHDVTAVVRSAAKSEQVRQAGATPVDVDLFDRAAVMAAVGGHDAIAHLATSIPTGASAGAKRGWKMNDRLRREASALLARAAIDAGTDRYLQESITFPYVDSGDAWIGEAVACDYFWGNASTVDAESAAAMVTDAGGTGVVLRFAMFMAADSAHMQTFAKMAGRGIWGLFGDDDAHVSFVDVDDAATAVVAALNAPAGIYNVAEPDPVSRGAHRAALAAAAGRPHLRGVPRLLEKMGGPSAESLSRSHRVSSEALSVATDWTPTGRPIDTWKELT